MTHHVYTPVRTIADLCVGAKITTDSRTMIESDVHGFCGLVGDSNAIHVSDLVARHAGFEKVLAPATLTASIAIALFGSTRWLHAVLMFFVGMSDWQVQQPVLPGDTLEAQVTIQGLRPTSDGQRFVLSLLFEVFATSGPSADRKRVMNFTAKFMARDQQTEVF